MLLRWHLSDLTAGDHPGDLYVLVPRKPNRYRLDHNDLVAPFLSSLVASGDAVGVYCLRSAIIKQRQSIIPSAGLSFKHVDLFGVHSVNYDLQGDGKIRLSFCKIVPPTIFGYQHVLKKPAHTVSQPSVRGESLVPGSSFVLYCPLDAQPPSDTIARSSPRGRCPAFAAVDTRKPIMLFPLSWTIPGTPTTPQADFHHDLDNLCMFLNLSDSSFLSHYIRCRHLVYKT